MFSTTSPSPAFKLTLRNPNKAGISSGGVHGSNEYEILARLATGGMAELFLARGTAVGDVVRHVVLKRVLPSFAGNEQYAKMFLDEARIAAQLRHPNIVQLYDVGRLGSSHFYTMEFVHGETVATILQRAYAMNQPMPVGVMLAIASGVATGLYHAHTRVGSNREPLGIVHRDVSLGNIMVGFDGVVKLLDFGVAKSVAKTTQTLAGTLKGKIAYLSPEQCLGQPVDLRSDLFSLGICMFEMLTTHHLFVRANELATINAIVNDAVTAPSAFRPEVPPTVDRLVLTALAKDKNQRFFDAEAMHEAIETVISSGGLAMSQAAIAKYMRGLFGHRKEPWLEQTLTPLKVEGEVVADPTGPVPLIELEATRDSRNMDELIEKVHKASPFAGNSEEPPERPSLPFAPAHPAWEPTLMGQQHANLDLTDRVPIEAFASVETQLEQPIGKNFDAVTDVAPLPVAQPVAPLPPQPTPRPVVLTPSAQRAYTTASMSPLKREPVLQWHRVAIAIALLVALVVMIVLLAT